MFALLLASAGTETVARLIGWAGVVLADYPDQRAELAADHSLIPNTVEELLRYEAPSPVQGRWTTADIELHGHVIPANSKLLLIDGAAGRYERSFTDADRFDIHRVMDHHLSFGYGAFTSAWARLGPSRRAGRPRGDPAPLSRMVGRSGPGRPTPHQYCAGLHQAAHHLLSGIASPPSGFARRGRLSAFLYGPPDPEPEPVTFA
jgi:hypothetical protein